MTIKLLTTRRNKSVHKVVVNSLNCVVELIAGGSLGIRNSPSALYRGSFCTKVKARWFINWLIKYANKNRFNLKNNRGGTAYIHIISSVF